MHNSCKESVKIADINGGWITILKEVGKGTVTVGSMANPKCVLVMDSYYMACHSRAL